MKQSRIRDDLKDALEVHQSLLEDESIQMRLSQLADWCLEALRNKGKIIFAGNGGSFADAQHLAAEFVSRLQFDRAPLASIALATNSSVMSAVGNDYGYDQVFARELRAVAQPGDVFIPITTSGNSQNILEAAKVANELSIRTMGLTGRSGGRLISVCECLCAPASRTERVQECHILLGHILCGSVETEFFKGSGA